MTFYEAAVEVLRRSGRPLHFKKITEVAIRDELLSHVGKTPESTMEDRLDQETKKDDASWIVRTRPGVYMLKADIAERLNEEAKKKDEAKRKKRDEERRARNAEREAEEEDEEISEVEDDEVEEEEDDDSADDADEGEDGDDEGDDAEGRDGGRRRRRRRGRGRGRGRGKEKSASPEPEAEKPEPSPSNKRNGHAKDEDSGGRGKRRGRRGGKRSSDKTGDFKKLEGERYESMAEAAFAVLNTNSRKPMHASDIAEIVFDKKLVKFHTHDPEATIESAIVTDNQVRARSGRRPLFAQYREGRWGLTQWGVSDDGIKKERQILNLASELRQEAEDQLGEAVARLKPEAFEMVVMTLLERLDYCNLKVSKRTSDGDTFFSADWRRGFSDLRVCVHVAADAEARLDGEAVDELRDTLEHYSAAEGIIVHVGDVSKEAVRASRDEEAAKVTIIDRKTFVRLLIDEGIGVRSFNTPLVMVDTAFIDALQR